MSGFFIALGCGLLSAMGVGGGSLLMLWLTGPAGLAAETARFVNLLFFLPSAGAGLALHSRGRLVRWDVAVPGALAGMAAGGLGLWLGRFVGGPVLEKGFGLLLLAAGLAELLRRPEGQTAA